MEAVEVVEVAQEPVAAVEAVGAVAQQLPEVVVQQQAGVLHKPVLEPNERSGLRSFQKRK